jgi:uncharacterized protein YjbI with pentapeptide repeats
MKHALLALFALEVALFSLSAPVMATPMPEAGPTAAVVPVCNGKYKGGLTPTSDELKEILRQHAAWLTDNSLLPGSQTSVLDPKVANDPRRANLCDADLTRAHLFRADLTSANLTRAHLFRADLGGAYLSSADLSGANLNGADLSGADLVSANLSGAYLTRANLTRATLISVDLTDANLTRAALSSDLTDANLTRADLRFADLTDANLTRANLRFADLTGAHLTSANLRSANLTSADLSGAYLTSAYLGGADLSGAHLTSANLTSANLGLADLSGADLRFADLTSADLSGTEVSKTHLSYTNLTNAVYAPASEPPNLYVAGIKGLATTSAGAGEEIGLVQLRKLLEDAGLRDNVRETTYAIQRGITRDQLSSGWRNPAWYAGVLRTVGLDLTTAYSLHPERALRLILLLGALAIPVYMFAIRRPTAESGIMRVFPAGRLKGTADPANEETEKNQLVHAEAWRKAFGTAAYFSLISAVNIGFEQFTPRDWIQRLQRTEYSLEAVGWVRVLAGAQALISVYLLAMWALTQFGQPFE